VTPSEMLRAGQRAGSSQLPVRACATPSLWRRLPFVGVACGRAR
jgi:hypothetical protein